jgi:phage/plasmid-associated DNA primase
MYIDENGKKKTKTDKRNWTTLTENDINKNHEVICVLAGKVSGITVLDFDTQEHYFNLIDTGILQNPNLYPTVITNRGVHIYVKYDNTILQPDKNMLDLDILQDRKRVYYPPTKYKLADGTYFTYTWEFDDGENMELLPCPERLKKHINMLSKKTKNTTTPIINTDMSLNDFSLQINEKIVNLINVSYLDTYEDWLKIVWAMKKLNYTQEFINKICSKSEKFNINQIDNFDADKCNFTQGTLNFYARSSNPDEYNKLFKDKKLDETLTEIMLSSTERGIAELVDIILDGKVLYDNNTCKIYSWCNNKWWCEDTKHTVILRNVVSTSLSTFINTKHKNILALLKQETNDENILMLQSKGKMLKDIITRSKTTSWINNICTELKGIIIAKDQRIDFDANDDVIAFDNNKKYNLLTGEWSDVLFTDRITMTTRYEYIKPTQEQADLIQKLITQIFPNEDIRKSYLSILFNSLCGGQKDRFTIANGGGGNGKGMLNTLMMRVVGDYGYTAPVSLLTKEFKQGANPEIANIHRKRLVLFKEPSKTEKLLLGNLKQLVGNDTINARGLYSGNTNVVLNCTCILESNLRLRFDSQAGDAEIRRLIDILFESKFTDNIEELNDPTNNNVFKKDISLTKKEFITKHTCALFDYIVDNADKNIYVPECVNERTLQYISSNDEFGDWINETYEYTKTETDIVKLKDMYNAFRVSEMYKNIERKDKPILARFKMDYVDNDKKLLRKYKDRYRPIINGLQQEMRSVFLGLKLRITDGNESE